MGQSEIEIAALADTTVVVVVPESGDDIQAMKAGLMEIADIFVVNKADRPDADILVRALRSMLSPAFHSQEHQVSIIKTIGTRQEGLEQLLLAIKLHQENMPPSSRKSWLLAEKAYYLIQNLRMKNVNKKKLQERILNEMNNTGFNLYRLVSEFRE